MLGIFLDTETNGLNSRKHRVIEIAYKIVDVLTGAQQEAFETVVYQDNEMWKKSDPESLKVNGFTWDRLKDGVKEAEVAEAIKASFAKNGIKRGEAVFICQNPSFDRIFFSQLIDVDTQEKLRWPYHWLDLASMYWAKALEKESPRPWVTGLSKNRIATAHKLPEEAHPHRAVNGVDHLIECYRAVVGFPCS